MYYFQVPLAQAYNLSYSGRRDQDDSSSKPAQANSLLDPILKKPLQKSVVEGLKLKTLRSRPSTTIKKVHCCFKPMTFSIVCYTTVANLYKKCCHEK
jgi:hypothetical protein